MAARKVGDGLAKVLGIKLEYRDELRLNEEIRRGESVFSSQTADTYVEEEPRSIEWVAGVIPSGSEFVEYCRSLFPFLAWIGRYNLQWLAGDMVAGERLPVRIISRSSKCETRDYNRCSGGPARNGICSLGNFASTIWPVLVIHGCAYLLVFCYFERHHHWGKLSLEIQPRICFSLTFKACRCYVNTSRPNSYEGESNPSTRRGTCYSLGPGCHCRLYYCLHWIDSFWKNRGAHSPRLDFCLHDRICNQYCSWSGPCADGYHWVQHS